MVRFLRVAFWAALLFALVMASLPRPPAVPGVTSDKIQHILAFAVLDGLGSAAYAKLRALQLLLALSGFGAVIEFVQLIPALHRDADVVDWIADTAAAALVIAVFAAARGRQRTAALRRE